MIAALSKLSVLRATLQSILLVSEQRRSSLATVGLPVVMGLLGLIWLIGSIILIVWFCRRGTVGENRFGPDPLAGVA